MRDVVIFAVLVYLADQPEIRRVQLRSSSYQDTESPVRVQRRDTELRASLWIGRGCKDRLKRCNFFSLAADGGSEAF